MKKVVYSILVYDSHGANLEYLCTAASTVYEATAILQETEPNVHPFGLFRLKDLRIACLVENFSPFFVNTDFPCRRFLSTSGVSSSAQTPSVTPSCPSFLDRKQG